MSTHISSDLMAWLRDVGEELKHRLYAAGEPGATIVGIATDTPGGLCVSAAGGATRSVCRLGLVAHLLEAMLDDPTTTPALASRCRAAGQALGIRLDAVPQSLQ